MKRLLLLFLCLLGFPALATNALLDLKDVRLSVGTYSNRVVILQPLSTPTVSTPSVVLGGQIIITNDVNGQNWYSNIFSGLYHVTVAAPPDRADFAFLVTATNLGNINVADNLVAASTATFPAGSVAWAAAVSDGRYSRGSNAPVSFYNVTNALGYTPQPSAPNLTNWSNVTTNSLLTLPYIGNSSGSGTNTLLDWVSSSDYSTFIHPYSTLGVELLYQKNDLSAASMLWRNIGSQLYINGPIISGATINGNLVGTFVGDGSGLTNLAQVNQGLFQYGTLELTNTWLYYGLNHQTLLGSSTNGSPIAYRLGTDLSVATGPLFYTLNSTAATSVTNGLGVALSNYVSTVSANATNEALLIGSNGTNESTRISNNATNEALFIGGNGTNQSLLIGLGATNESLLIGLGATNESARIGNNATNNDLKVGLGATNNDLLLGTALTNNVLVYSNNALVAFQKGSAALTNISGASGTPSSSTFLRGDYSWQAPAGVGTVTSVAMTVPVEFSLSGSPITSAGTLALSKANETANFVYAGPASGGPGVPTFRALTSSDIPVPAITGWQLTGNSGTAPGANFLGTTDLQPLMLKVNSSQAMILRNSGAIIVGGSDNSAGTSDAILSGKNNIISSVGVTYNLIAGGQGHTIAATSGGNTISGGSGNSIGSSAAFATVAGGQNSQANGSSSFVAGGNGNIAGGIYSFAGGTGAHANNQGAFVWADSQGFAFSSTNNDSFNIRAQGGLHLRGPFDLTGIIYGNGAGVTNIQDVWTNNGSGTFYFSGDVSSPPVYRINTNTTLPYHLQSFVTQAEMTGDLGGSNSWAIYENPISSTLQYTYGNQLVTLIDPAQDDGDAPYVFDTPKNLAVTGTVLADFRSNQVSKASISLAGIGIANGFLIHSNSLSIIPTLAKGDVFLWSSNGVLYSINSNQAGTLTTNKLAP